MNRSCTESEAKVYFNRIVGTPLRYGIKSADTNLYDLGFGNDTEYIGWTGILRETCTYAIHLTGGIIVYWENGGKVEYCDATPHTEFHADIHRLIGLCVRRVTLSEKNDLWLDFGECRMVIVTREDGEESWRLFLPGTGEPHLVASDLWLRMD